jgi:hypothetical protein
MKVFSLVITTLIFVLAGISVQAANKGSSKITIEQTIHLSPEDSAKLFKNMQGEARDANAPIPDEPTKVLTLGDVKITCIQSGLTDFSCIIDTRAPLDSTP